MDQVRERQRYNVSELNRGNPAMLRLHCRPLETYPQYKQTALTTNLHQLLNKV